MSLSTSLEGASVPQQEKLCIACRSPIRTGATKCKECGSYQGRPCAVCAKPLPPPRKLDGRWRAGSPKCTECDSFQQLWRRALPVSDTFLALLTALFAVVAVAWPSVRSFISPVSIYYLGLTSNGTHLRFLVTNQTDNPVYLREAKLKSAVLDSSGSQKWTITMQSESSRPLTEAPIPPGTHPIELRPTNLDPTNDASPTTQFQLNLDFQPALFQPDPVELRNISQFVNAYRSRDEGSN